MSRAKPTRVAASSRSNGGNTKSSLENYMLGKTIGEGTFGKVKIGIHIPTREKVAIKILEKSRIVEIADVERVTREIQILKKNRHKNIIQLFEVIDTPQAIFLIMENADGGEMFDYIVTKQRIPEEEAVCLLHQIVDGLEYLHCMEVTHRDLKPENLLLQQTPFGINLKIVDFGLSNTHTNGKLLKTACGSPCYAAPEMIAGHEYVGPLADIWSLGVILYAMVCGYLPFEDNNTSVLYKKILSGDYVPPNFISSSVRDLIRKILETDPEKRYTIDKIRQHPWYNSVFLSKPTVREGPELEEINETVVQKLESIGIPRKLVLKGILKQAHNTYTTSYYLMLNKYNRTMSEMESKSLRNSTTFSLPRQYVPLPVPLNEVSSTKEEPNNVVTDSKDGTLIVSSCNLAKPETSPSHSPQKTKKEPAPTVFKPASKASNQPLNGLQDTDEDVFVAPSRARTTNDSTGLLIPRLPHLSISNGADTSTHSILNRISGEQHKKAIEKKIREIKGPITARTSSVKISRNSAIVDARGGSQTARSPSPHAPFSRAMSPMGRRPSVESGRSSIRTRTLSSSTTPNKASPYTTAIPGRPPSSSGKMKPRAITGPSVASKKSTVRGSAGKENIKDIQPRPPSRTSLIR